MEMHIPVLLNETISGLNLKPGAVAVDATINGGGHSSKILEAIGENGVLLGIDRDEKVLEELKRKTSGERLWQNAKLAVGNFRELDGLMDSFGIAKADAFLFDLGMSSVQIDESGRGFSFQKDEPLLMTMKSNPEHGDLTAREIVNDWREEELENIIRTYGEERFSRRIAANIVRRREIKPIETTLELVDVIRESVPGFYRRGRVNCATRTFQALRIAVNDELNAAKEGLEKAWDRLNIGGRAAAISFHSLEDRIVKNFFKEKALLGEGALIDKKPITASEEERLSNPRSRSAKLRIIEKIK
ncbi:MAG: 16S rRNA (cytosine(1402)-N(4))-methyltransferase RsmH [Candidatus Paceibacter sp.]|nr:16S rRNA (cytosine(1402)-N(4))-methyltransferase RsmH [Candidatus Paceibacter sp.]